MKIMRLIPIILSILCAASVSAQVRHSFDGDHAAGKEPTRREVLPYNKVRVVAGDKDAYAFIAVPTDWKIEKSENRTEYRSTFTMPVSWLNRQVLLRIGRSAEAFDVAVNGKKAGYSPSGATAAEFNITKYAQKGRNEIVITLHDDARVNGIFRQLPNGIADVKVVCQPTIRIRDIVCETTLEDNGDGSAEIGIIVKCDALNPKQARIEYALRFRDTVLIAEGSRDIALDMRREDTLRICTRIPKEALWSAAAPNMLKIELTNRIAGRIAESVSREVGFRATALNDNALYINGRPAVLHLADYNQAIDLENFKASGFNGIIVANGTVPDSFYDECDRRGIYVVSSSAIDTTPFGDSIKRGGNPGNDPEWCDTFLTRNEDNFLAVRSHPSVVGYIIGRGNGTGFCFYETYLMMKRLEPTLPIIYESAHGEWCSDKVRIR